MSPRSLPRLCCLAAFALGLAPAAWAQSDVYQCTDAKGTKRYENSDKPIAGCKKVDMDAISVIPSSKRVQRLPIAIGMSRDQVANNWGKPTKVQRTQTRNGMSEQWTYAGGTLTFNNGVLEMIQN